MYMANDTDSSDTKRLVKPAGSESNIQRWIEERREIVLHFAERRRPSDFRAISMPTVAENDSLM